MKPSDLPLQIRRQGGLTLIEVLVAVIILSFGLISLAGLQGYSLQINQDSYLRSQATNLVYEVMDHLRANRSAVEAGTVPDETDLDEKVAARLPSGDLEVTIDNAPLGVVTVTVTWFDNRRTQDTDQQTLSYSVTSRI